MNGIINVLKPPKMTSHDVVGFIRKCLNMKKVGHTGTLDPMASGVLPICIGEATKVSQYLLNDKKKYRCEMTLGKNTDTQDRWGKVIKEWNVNVTKEEIIEAIQSFVGEINQTPPMYSAVRHKGKKLYELAREGQVVERKSRKVYIHHIDILTMDENKILFDVLCSKGTYVRTLCEDIGNKLGCGAYMSFLLRTKSGRFELKETVTIEELQEQGHEKIKENYLFPIDYPLVNMLRIDVKEASEKYLRNGNNLYPKNIKDEKILVADTVVRLYIKDKFIALGKVKIDKEWYIDIDRVFN